MLENDKLKQWIGRKGEKSTVSTDNSPLKGKNLSFDTKDNEDNDPNHKYYTKSDEDEGKNPKDSWMEEKWAELTNL